MNLLKAPNQPWSRIETPQTTGTGRNVLIGEPIPLASKLVSPPRDPMVLTNAALSQRSRGTIGIGSSRPLSPGAHLLNLGPLQLPNRVPPSSRSVSPSGPSRAPGAGGGDRYQPFASPAPSPGPASPPSAVSLRAQYNPLTMSARAAGATAGAAATTDSASGSGGLSFV